MTYAVRFLILLTVLALFPMPGMAAGGGRIVAVVNDDAITASDLDDRLRLTIVASGLSDSPELRARFSRDVLRSLIDEKLQLQEAKRLNITVTEDDINTGINRIAAQNHIDASRFLAALANKGVPRSVLADQVRAGFAWNKVIDRKIRPAVRIGDSDVDALVERVKSRQGRNEVHLAEIFLPVDTPQQEAQTAELAERLVQQIRKGAPFPAVARQFSRSAGAGTGGDMGWIGEGQLPAELDKAAFSMQRGTLSAPIRAADGFHILLVLDKRVLGVINQPEPEAPRPSKPASRTPVKSVTLAQLIIPLAPDATKEQLKAAGEKIVGIGRKLRGCDSLVAAANKHGTPDSGMLGELKPSSLAKPVRQAIDGLPVGAPSPILRNGEGLVIFMVCKRVGGDVIKPAETEAPAPAKPSAPPQMATIDANAVRNSMLQNQIDVRARSYMRDLREAAFIELRNP